MKKYEQISVEIVLLESADIVTSSPQDGGFNGNGDTNWAW